MWVLGIDFRSSGKRASDGKCWTISPACTVCTLINRYLMELAQQVKMLVTKSNNLSLVHRTTFWSRDWSREPIPTSFLLNSITAPWNGQIHSLSHTQTQTLNKYSKTNLICFLLNNTFQTQTPTNTCFLCSQEKQIAFLNLGNNRQVLDRWLRS